MLFGRGFAHEELVVRGPTRMFARLDDELTVGSENRFAIAQRTFVEIGDAQITMNGRDVAEAKSGQVACETFG